MAKKIINQSHEGVFRDNPATGHNHTYYSLNDAPQSPDDYVKRCKEIGFKSVALNDHGTLLGVHPFMDACKKYDMNGIPGLEAYSKVCPAVLERLDKYKAFLSGRTHLIVNPMTHKGYQKISYALRDANLFIEKLKKLTYPIMGCDILEKYFTDSDDVFATSACAQGAIGYILLTNNRLEHKLSKEKSICEEYSKEYNEYIAMYEQQQGDAEQIKAKKKERTALLKYTKPTHNNKIAKLREKVEKLENGDAEKLAKAKDELEEAIRLQEKATNELPTLESAIEALEKLKEERKAPLAELKKSANKYIKAKDIIDSQEYLSDEELYECAKIQLLYYKSIFKKFYIELQYHGIDSEEYIMPILLRLADETNTPIIAANDAHVTENTEEWFETRRIVRYNYFERSQETEESDRELYIKNDWELIDALATIIPRDRAEEAVRNTDIFNQCNVVFPQGEHYPSVKTDETFDELLEKAKQELVEAGEWNDVYEARYNHEIKTIKNMGYVDYHMVVRDFCNEARILGVIPKEELGVAMSMSGDFNLIHKWIEEKGFKGGVGVGPGRGSAAGSLVCYLLGITNINPMKYNLLFERFLNPERVSMPDIDSDIKTSIRPLLIKYIQWKYGERSVCSIATETTYAARGAVQMAGRERASQLYDYLPEKEAKPFRQKYLYTITQKISEMIPEKPGITLSECETDFGSQFGNNEEAKLLWDHAKLLEGRICGTGIHAGGVIISDNDNINDYIALAWNEKNGIWAAQCDMVKAEEIGLLKMDLLGLETLDIITDTIHYVKRYKNIDINIDEIPFEPEVFEAIYAKGDTNSVFQYESSGMKSMLKEFKPTCFEDLIVLVACYRPGPMQYLEDIIAVKNGRKEITYKTPELEEILSATYGAVVYQEQVMQIFQKLAGYSLGAADMVRRAMSKKKTEKLEAERNSFIYGDEERNIDGCIKRGITAEIANSLFDEMMDFAKYAFNKSHAACYAAVSYQTGWLKYHYPLEYLCALFNNKDLDSYEPLYADCRAYGIEVLSPSINDSYFEFVEEGDSIRYGFKGIKGLGETKRNILEGIAENRKDGDYTSLQDFLKRNLIVTVDEDGTQKIGIPSKDDLKSLVSSGCFDCFGYNREAVLDVTSEFKVVVPKDEEVLVDYVKDMIDEIKIAMVPKDIADNMDKEVEFLKTILSENPLKKYGDDEVYGCVPIEDMKPGRASIFGFVTSAILKKSAKGNNMILITLQGKTGTCTVMAMNSVYDAYASNLDSLMHHVVKISGSINDGGSMFANTINELAVKKEEYFIDLTSEKDTEFISSLRSKTLSTKGNIKVMIQFHFNRKKGTKELVPRQTPTVAEMYFTDEEIEAIKGFNIKVEKWNG